jgi:hypothetical protein
LLGFTLDGDEIAVEGEVVWVAEPVRARRLTEDVGRGLQQVVRRGKHESIRVRRTMIIMASALRQPSSAGAVLCHQRHERQPVVRVTSGRGQAWLRAKMTAPGPSSSGPMTSSASIVNPASRSQPVILLGRRW